MTADAMSLCVTRLSATILLSMEDKRGLLSSMRMDFNYTCGVISVLILVMVKTENDMHTGQVWYIVEWITQGCLDVLLTSSNKP